MAREVWSLSEWFGLGGGGGGVADKRSVALRRSVLQTALSPVPIHSIVKTQKLLK